MSKLFLQLLSCSRIFDLSAPLQEFLQVIKHNILPDVSAKRALVTKEIILQEVLWISVIIIRINLYLLCKAIEIFLFGDILLIKHLELSHKLQIIILKRSYLMLKSLYFIIVLVFLSDHCVLTNISISTSR